MAQTNLKRISELTGVLWAKLPQKKVGEILDKDIVILEFTRREGRLGEYALIRAKGPDGEEIVVRTGAKAVLTDLEQVRGELPLLGRFEERKGASGRTYLVLV